MKRSEHGGPYPFIPRGLSRTLAAFYIGVGTTKFDEMIKDGRMPPPKRVDGRTIWDRHEIDVYFQDLPIEAPKSDWDFIDE